MVSETDQTKTDMKDLEDQAISHLFMRNIDYQDMSIQSSKWNIQTVLDLIANAKNGQNCDIDLRNLGRVDLAKILGLKVISSKSTKTKIAEKEGTKEADGNKLVENTSGVEAKDVFDPFWFCGLPSSQLLALIGENRGS